MTQPRGAPKIAPAGGGRGGVPGRPVGAPRAAPGGRSLPSCPRPPSSSSSSSRRVPAAPGPQLPPGAPRAGRGLLSRNSAPVAAGTQSRVSVQQRFIQCPRYMPRVLPVPRAPAHPRIAVPAGVGAPCPPRARSSHGTGTPGGVDGGRERQQRCGQVRSIQSTLAPSPAQPGRAGGCDGMLRWHTPMAH